MSQLEKATLQFITSTLLWKFDCASPKRSWYRIAPWRSLIKKKKVKRGRASRYRARRSEREERKTRRKASYMSNALDTWAVMADSQWGITFFTFATHDRGLKTIGSRSLSLCYLRGRRRERGRERITWERGAACLNERCSSNHDDQAVAPKYSSRVCVCVCVQPRGEQRRGTKKDRRIRGAKERRKARVSRDDGREFCFVQQQQQQPYLPGQLSAAFRNDATQPRNSSVCKVETKCASRGGRVSFSSSSLCSSAVRLRNNRSAVFVPSKCGLA